MISAVQVDDEFAAHGVSLRSAQHVDFEIGFFGRGDCPYWIKNDTLCIPIGAADEVEDVDLEIVCGRDVWIYYDENDQLAKTKARDLCGLMRSSSLRPYRAAFIDRTNHIRVLTAESRGWMDVTPAGYDELKTKAKTEASQ